MVFVKSSNMKKICTTLCIYLSFAANAQTHTSHDSAAVGKVTVIKDTRIDELARKEASFNEVVNLSPKAGRGYRLMVLSTNDRPLAMKVRTQLLQRYPDQQIYMIYQPPNIKLKLGDYVEKSEAESMRKDLLRSKIVTGNIYVVPDKIEIKPDKLKDAGSER